jgi:NAD(P)-dependent dehydrogenase (short-subunit alcohol dehydrogenase family)
MPTNIFSKSSLASAAIGLSIGLFAVSAALAETVLVTGANRGIGLEFCKQYAAKGWNVIATHRRDETPETLTALTAEYPNLISAEQMDVTNLEQIRSIAAKYEGQPIDIVINNAGILSDFTNFAAHSFGTLDHSEFSRFMETNSHGALMVSEAFAEHVKASETKKIVAITSQMGSIGINFGNVPSFYWDLKKHDVTVILLSPGQVAVEKVGDMRMPNMIEPSESISGMINVIEGLTVEQTGSYIRYNGEPQQF